MTDLEKWQEGNAQYLSAAISWLRRRLERRAESHVRLLSAVTTPSPPSAESFWDRIRGKAQKELPAGVRALLSPASDTQADIELAEAAVQMGKLETEMTPTPALSGLARRLGLSRFEQEVLLLCAGVELDTQIPLLCAQAQNDPTRAFPTFALALSLFEDPAWEALTPERPLRYWRLIEITQPGGQPLTTSTLRADERIVNYIKGLNHLDDRLTPLFAPIEAADASTSLPASQQSAAQSIVQQLRRAEPSAGFPIVHLLGPDSESKQFVAAAVASALGLRLLRFPGEQLPAHAAELETLARLWFRESLLLPVALYLDAREVQSGPSGEAQSSPVQRFLAQTNGIIFLDTREAVPHLPRASFHVEIGKPSHAEQQAAWDVALGSAVPGCGAVLAEQFHLNLSAIQRIARAALQEAPYAATLRQRVWDACVVHTRPRLENLAQRLDPKATWDDIVLPAQEVALLRQIAAQVGHRSTVYQEWGFRDKMTRGLGINALFCGESGTGKTMAAEVIANDLRLNLYRIDLSAVVSKYIGETEKNLRRLFDAAEDGGAILFFDEADALFGKRSEVKDSHDRYANIEINYLLQRMEAYRGLAILATNMKSALDSAFLRRLRFIVNFPFPGPVERKAIWQKVFPPQTPRAGLDLDRLARLNLTGGSIHNIALNAAFLAAQADTPVTMPLALDAARTEFRKLERPINEADFRWQVAAGAVA